MNTLRLIQQRYSTMSPVEKRIADCILGDPQMAVHATIVYVAAKAQVSEGSVVNFASSLGFKGFSQLKIHLAQSLQGFEQQDEFLQDDTPKQIMRKQIERAKMSFESTYDAMKDEMELAAQWLIKADSIIVVGFANSQFVASDLAYRLMRIGLPAQAFSDPLIASVACAQMTDKSVMLAVSNFGRTRDLLACAKLAKEGGAHLICMTSNVYSPLAKECELILMSISAEAENFQESVTSRLTQLLICDSLMQYVALKIGDEAIVRLDKMVEIYEQYREAP